MENVKDKVVIITGASSGIGAQTVTLLAERGARLVLAARREEALATLANELISTYQANVIYQPTDVTKLAEVESLITLAKQHFGRMTFFSTTPG